MLHSSRLQTLVALKKAGCVLALVALKRTGCDVWQMECQASNVTANVQSDHLLHEYMLPVPVFFASDQLHPVHRPPRSAEIQSMSQQDASATCPHRGLVLDSVKKMKNLCILQGSAVTFSGVVGKGATVCFVLR